MYHQLLCRFSLNIPGVMLLSHTLTTRLLKTSSNIFLCFFSSILTLTVSEPAMVGLMLKNTGVGFPDLT